MPHENCQCKKDRTKASDTPESEKSAASKKWRAQQALEGKKQLSILIRKEHEQAVRELAARSVSLPPGTPLFDLAVTNLPRQAVPAEKADAASVRATRNEAPQVQAPQKLEPSQAKPHKAQPAPHETQMKFKSNTFEWIIGNEVLNKTGVRAGLIRWLAKPVVHVDLMDCVAKRRIDPNVGRGWTDEIFDSWEWQTGYVLMNMPGPRAVFMRRLIEIFNISNIWYYQSEADRRQAKALSRGANS